MNTFWHGTKSLVLVAFCGLTLAACSTTSSLQKIASQPPPPIERDAAAATYKWKPTVNYQLQINNGFDADGRLREDGLPTYFESSAVAQISGRCAKNLEEGVNNIGWLKMRRTIQGGGAQAVGSLVGAFAGFKNPTQPLIRQVVGLTAGTAFFANYDAIDFQIQMILAAGHAQCVRDRAQQVNLLKRVTVVMTPLIEFNPSKTLPPGTPDPVF